MCRHFVSLKIAYILSYGKRKDRMSGDFLKKKSFCVLPSPPLQTGRHAEADITSCDFPPEKNFSQIPSLFWSMVMIALVSYLQLSAFPRESRCVQSNTGNALRRPTVWRTLNIIIPLLKFESLAELRTTTERLFCSSEREMPPQKMEPIASSVVAFSANLLLPFLSFLWALFSVL